MPVIQTALCLIILVVSTATGVHAQDLTTVPLPEPVIPAVSLPGPESGFTDETPIDETPGRDIVLVLENSASMKVNDPQARLAGAITAFINRLPIGTRIAVVTYGEQAELAMPFLPVDDLAGDRLTATLAGFSYASPNADSPAGLERAMLELNNAAREGAERSIIFLTDGPVASADTNRDGERTLWMQQELASDIAGAGIRIYSLGLAEAAGSEMVRTVALRTGGETFSAARAEDLPAALDSIAGYLRQEAGPAAAGVEDTAVESVEQTATASVPASPTPAVTAVPTVSVPAIGEEERKRSVIIMIAAVILTITLVALIVLLVRRGRQYRQASEVTVSEAFLYDLTGKTSTPSYRLGKKPVMFGRVAGKDTEHLDYIVIPESTIGRRHATIEYKDYAYWIMDQGSINGTFVNDVRVTSETRLKHGDRIRLHKIEFDFVMPDLEEAGMTRVAEPAGMAGAAADLELDVESVKSSLGADGAGLDFDFSGGRQAKAAAGDEETLMPGFGAGKDVTRPGSSEVTLMPDQDYAAKSRAVPGDRGDDRDDETLMPNDYHGVADEDATLQPSSADQADEIFDITGADKKKR